MFLIILGTAGTTGWRTLDCRLYSSAIIMVLLIALALQARGENE